MMIPADGLISTNCWWKMFAPNAELYFLGVFLDTVSVKPVKKAVFGLFGSADPNGLNTGCDVTSK